MKPKSLSPSRSLPPRRLLAIAAAAALFSSQGAHASSQTKHPKATLTGEEVVCPLGTFICPPRPDNFAICRPNGMLEFYDPFLSKDSALRANAKTNVWADHVESPDQVIYHLSGNVKTIRADQELHADVADYNSDTSDYDARGKVHYQEATHLVSADHITGNTNDSTGLATGNVRFQMLDSHGNGTAVRGEMLDADRNRYTMATYSTCDIGRHIWEIRAKQIDTNDVTARGVAKGATMSMYGVPFFYFPWMTFPLNNDRQSGFLYPYFEHTGKAGYQFRIPYYFNLAPNYDATLTPRYYSLRGAMLSGEVRYMFPKTSGQFEIEFLPRDNYNDQKLTSSSIDTQGKQRYLYSFVNNTSLWPGWSLSTNIMRASDKNYLRDFGNDLFTISTELLYSSVYLNGSGNWWNASIGGDVWQNVDPSLDNNIVEPYKRLPRATFNMDIPFARWYDFGLNSEAVKFHKFNQVEGTRVDLYPYVDADFQGPAWFIRPKLAYRYTTYSLDSGYQRYGYGYGQISSNTSPFTQSNPTRSLPVISLDQGLIFERSTSLFGSNYTQTLEPRLYYLYVPYRNQNNLPLFDTAPMAFDDWMLFAPNQFSGADRQMNANNLTAAVTTRFLDDGGVERISATFGQIRYFTPQRVQTPCTLTNTSSNVNNCAPATNWSGSDYVAELSTQLNDQWTASTEYLWNPNTRLTDLGTFTLQRRLGFDGILNFSYRFRRGLVEQYDVSAVYPLSERWRLIGEWTYSELDKRTVEALAGVQYEGCCVKVSVVARHFVTGYYGVVAALPPGQTAPGSDTAVMFQLEFKGLGTFSGQTESVLRRDILGYQ